MLGRPPRSSIRVVCQPLRFDLVAVVKGATPVDAKAALRFVELNHPDGQTPLSREDERRARRYLAFPDNADGTHSVVGNLPDADARTVQTALASIAEKPGPDDHRTYGRRLADALVQLCGRDTRREVKGGRSNLPTLLVVIGVDDLNGATDGPGYTSRRDVISAEAVRRLMWNADIARILMNDSVPLDLGRAQRLASNDQWRALAVRDGGCRIADCHIPAGWCRVGHIQEWDAEHGPTDVDLLVLWCTFHHSFRHRKDVAPIGDANDFSMHLPGGTIISSHHEGQPTATEPNRNQHRTGRLRRPPVDHPPRTDRDDRAGQTDQTNQSDRAASPICSEARPPRERPPSYRMSRYRTTGLAARAWRRQTTRPHDHDHTTTWGSS